MRYKVKDIGEAGLEIRVDLSLAWLSAECADLNLKPGNEGLLFQGRLEAVGEEFLLRGVLHGVVIGQCARCLEEAKVPVEVTLTSTFTEEIPEDDQEDLAEGDDLVLIENGIVDISPILRDELLLALPMSPICSETCKGICSTCGANNNLTQCECASATRANSKFAVLAKMRRE